MEDLFDMSKFMTKEALFRITDFVQQKVVSSSHKFNELSEFVHTSPIVLLILEQIFDQKNKSINDLYFNTDAKGYMIAFMIENGRFVRFDVDSDRYTAPGGIKVGDSADAVMKAWSDQVESMPHKYVEGARYLTVTPRGGGESKLLFEVSPEARVQSWRIGIPPAVFYVEACS